MNTYLLFLICVLALFQGERDRFSALTYAMLCAGHTVILGGLEGHWYFLSAAIADALIVITLCFKSPVSRLSDILISISMFSGAVNAIGCLAWNFCAPVEPYYYSCLSLYIIVILAMIREDGNRYGGNLLNRFFRGIGRPGYALRCVLREAAK